MPEPRPPSSGVRRRAAAISAKRSDGHPRADLAAALIRPDGFVAWAAAPGAVDSDGLDRALRTWFGR